MPVWVAIVAAAAFSLEGCLWVGAGVFGWGFLAKRRASSPAGSPAHRNRNKPSGLASRAWAV